jgi:hypothetical protein
LLRKGYARAQKERGGDQYWYDGCSFMIHGRFYSTPLYRRNASITC